MESLVDENEPEDESDADILFDEINFEERERWRGFDIVLDTLNLQYQVLNKMLKVDWQSAQHLLGAAKEMEHIFSEQLDKIESQMNMMVNHD